MVIQEENKRNNPLPLDSLIVLSNLRRERRLDIHSLSNAIQKRESHTRGVIERLVESGLVEGHGTGRGRTYTLSVQLYRRAGKKAGYILQSGFDPIQQEQMILKYIDKHGRITRKEAMALCHINFHQAYRLLKKLKDDEKIQMIGKLKAAYYKSKS